MSVVWGKKKIKSITRQVLIKRLDQTLAVLECVSRFSYMYVKQQNQYKTSVVK